MFKDFFAENYLVFAVAILIGILIVTPSFYFRYFDPTYKGIDFFGSDSETAYLAQIQEIYDGHFSLGNIYFADEKDRPYIQQPLSPILVALMGRLFGISARDVNLLTKFILPMLLTVLLFALFKVLTQRKGLALLMAVFVMLTQASSSFLNPGIWFKILFQGEFPGTNANFLAYSRPINPQVSSFFFFGYLLCLLLFLRGAVASWKGKALGILSALILGLSFYTYFFAYSFLAVWSGILFGWFLFLRDWLRLKRLGLVFLGAAVVAIPYFLNVLSAMQFPFYIRIFQMSGSAETYRFIFSRLWWAAFLVFVLFHRRFGAARLFFGTFLAAAFLVTNQQLITGRTMPLPAHYHWYYIAPLAGAFLFYIFFVHLERLTGRSISRLLTGFTVILFFYTAILFQRGSYAAQREFIVSYQRYAPALFWLDKNAGREATVFANDMFSGLVTAYTGQNVYYDPRVNHYLTSDERMRNAFYVYLFLGGVTRDNAMTFISSNKDMIGSWFFGQYYRAKNGCYGCFDNNAILDDIVRGYNKFLSNDFIFQLKRYPLDYAVWDKEKNPEWDLDRFFENKIYEEDDIAVYKVTNT